MKVEFVGGARDGAVIDIPEPLPRRWVIPCVLPAVMFEEAALDRSPRLKVWVYELKRVGFYEPGDPYVTRPVYRLIGTGVV